jgi:hypothetical protein
MCNGPTLTSHDVGVRVIPALNVPVEMFIIATGEPMVEE